MKQLTCEMCGSTNLMKQDGVFVCQTCGCKYSVEEAKKMMIEGAVDVSGSTVKVDNSAFVQKYLANARRAKEKEDWEETEKYYNMVEQNDPDNIEAIFYSAYGKAKATLVDEDIYKRQAAFRVLENCVSVIDDHYKVERKEENKEAITAMAFDLGMMVNSNFVFTQWKNGYGIVTKTNKNETYIMFATLLDAFKQSIDNIQKIDDQPYLHRSLISLCNMAKMAGFNENTKDLMDRWIDEETQELAALVEKYWSEHADEKAAFESEVNTLQQQIAEQNKAIDNLPEAIALSALISKKVALENELSGLGIFKLKEKKELQNKIDTLTQEISSAVATKVAAAASFSQNIEKFTARIDEINNMLSNGK